MEKIINNILNFLIEEQNKPDKIVLIEAQPNSGKTYSTEKKIALDFINENRVINIFLSDRNILVRDAYDNIIDMIDKEKKEGYISKVINNKTKSYENINRLVCLTLGEKKRRKGTPADLITKPVDKSENKTENAYFYKFNDIENNINNYLPITIVSNYQYFSINQSNPTYTFRSLVKFLDKSLFNEVQINLYVDEAQSFFENLIYGITIMTPLSVQDNRPAPGLKLNNINKELSYLPYNENELFFQDKDPTECFVGTIKSRRDYSPSFKDYRYGHPSVFSRLIYENESSKKYIVSRLDVEFNVTLLISYLTSKNIEELGITPNYCYDNNFLANVPVDKIAVRLNNMNNSLSGESVEHIVFNYDYKNKKVSFKYLINFLKQIKTSVNRTAYITVIELIKDLLCSSSVHLQTLVCEDKGVPLSYKSSQEKYKEFKLLQASDSSASLGDKLKYPRVGKLYETKLILNNYRTIEIYKNLFKKIFFMSGTIETFYTEMFFESPEPSFLKQQTDLNLDDLIYIFYLSTANEEERKEIEINKKLYGKFLL